MGERGMSSQVYVFCRSHNWLDVEEERECSSWKEKEEVKVKKLPPHVRTLALPFIRQGAGYISEGRENEKEVMHA
jgi:hypothetical protein